MLSVRDVHKRFGGNRVLQGAAMDVAQGEFIGLIGPNGSGKTTLLNCISGMLKPEQGRILFKKKNIAGLPPHRISQLGVGRTFQITKVFRRLSLLENLKVPALARGDKDDKNLEHRALEILTGISLQHMATHPASTLSGGQQKLLEVGIIMMTEPALLLLDEPFGGVHPELKLQLENYLRQLNEEGRTVILISHEMTSVFRMCQRLVVLYNGAVICDGSPEEVRSNEVVIEAYLGAEDAA